jgi:hypothetical protein
MKFCTKVISRLVDTLHRHTDDYEREMMMKKVALAVIFAAGLVAFSLAHADNGSATTTMELVVPTATTVNCYSPSVTASTPGLQTMTVTCEISGNPVDFASSGNSFSPATTPLTSGSNTLTATRGSTVTSSDGSVTNITGNSAGFNGDLNTGFTQWEVSVDYTTTTTPSTAAGTYTSGTITYAWSFL